MNNRTQEKTQQHLITKESLRTSISTRAKTPCCGSTTTKENNDQIASSSTAETEPATVVNSATKPRCRRQWEQWSWEEKKCFYEGLAEYGKDYSKIQSFMNKKLKLKNYSDGKTKEQIRFFYHRTWSKIAKKLNLQPEEDSKKACRRELHYLLCLGELRKKQSAGFGAKVMKQLDELATKGITYVRLNGRNLRVRPPNRYLRKIYKDISDSPEIQLPKTVTIEFLPNSNMAFNFVQKHAFNPRIRFTGVSINARFSEVFEMLNKRFMDVYTNTNLNLQIYPMQSDTDFSKLLSNAIELLATYDKTQVTDIVVEKDKPKDNLLVEDVTIETTCTDKEHHQMELEQVLPQIFAKHGEKETPDGGSSEKGTTLKKSNSFPGYWTYIDAKEIFLRTLFVVFEQKPVFKFKYEWKQSVDESVDNCTFNKMALQNLAKLCDVKKEEDSVPQTDSRMSVISPLLQSPNFLYARKPGEGAISTTHQDGHGLMNGTSGKWFLPNRPRPGRINKSRQQLGNNIAGVTSPLLALSSGKAQCKTVLNNAVAVNLIPQHQQNLLHMAHLQHNSNKLVNNSASTVVHGVQDEVIAEGFQEHYQALANMIKSSALVKGQRNNENNNFLKTPVKVNPIPSNIPASPNLEWLNETVDISMTSFLNVCDMQALQNKRQAMQSKNTASSLHNNLKPNVSLDPVLPKFESSEISQGPLYDLAFELSNHATKSKDQYTVT